MGEREGTICREKEPFLGNMHHLQGDRAIYRERGIIFREKTVCQERGTTSRKRNDKKGEGILWNEMEQ